MTQNPFQLIARQVLLTLAGSILLASPAFAGSIELVPPNDTTGYVSSADPVGGYNGFGSGRTIGFQVDSTHTISSFGLLLDTSDTTFTFSVYEISSLSGSFTKTATLRTGVLSNVSTAGLAFVDFSFADLVLNPGTNYLLEAVANAGNAFSWHRYANQNVTWSQNGYINLDGGVGSSFNNTVVAAFRVDDASVSDIPAPGALVLMGLGLAGLAAQRKGLRHEGHCR